MDDAEIKKGIVAAIEPGGLVVRFDNEEECGGCRSCAVKSLCRGRDSGQMELPLSLEREIASGYAIGDRIAIRYRAANPAVTAVILFLPTLLGLSFGGFIANVLFQGGDGVFLAGTAVGIAIGLAVTLAAYHAFPSLKPEIRLANSVEIGEK